MPKITDRNWYWHHNVSECYYHIQLTIKYRKKLFDPVVEKVVVDVLSGFRDRYYIDVHNVGFDKDHVHLLCRFLPKYSGGQVIRMVKSITSQRVFKELPSLEQELWGGEFWTDGYYISTISGRGDKNVIERYIENQGRAEDVKQLRLFET
ncbi:IS200/IS605 family transposase [Muricauda sp. 334s03]|uniref:IS200/IS605 family transposase n=1 Tax=Flagellimonas yonaguniensis TaxID=3031325 RepID=A0ABT5XZV5_9FLAO|nr:IS200/IS605 family transposase [[Muricauda] yonaguniensis]MDF0716616.1 IS200/IS605 family transposase [[Muricauda] yonaguniensis]